MNKTIGFIGAGKMATAIIKGLLSSNLYEKNQIFASEPNAETSITISRELGITIYSDNTDVIKKADVIILAVKPFILKEVLQEIKGEFDDTKLVISIAAGISTASISQIIGDKAKVVRVMPNTPALVSEGMSALCFPDNISDTEKECVEKVFLSIGKIVQVSESQIDAVTGVSGSGPAFYYHIINEIAKAGEKLGLDYNTSLILSSQTALGSAKMILETGVSPEQLIINVTTPGGTTAEGNKVLNESNISEILYETIEKTTKKSIQLGKEV